MKQVLKKTQFIDLLSEWVIIERSETSFCESSIDWLIDWRVIEWAIQRTETSSWESLIYWISEWAIQRSKQVLEKAQFIDLFSEWEIIPSIYLFSFIFDNTLYFIMSWKSKKDLHYLSFCLLFAINLLPRLCLKLLLDHHTMETLPWTTLALLMESALVSESVQSSVSYM